MIHKLLQACIKDILLHADRYTWSLQGFGMLRTYLPNDVRVNIWDSRYRVPDVSLMHNHPWDFDSVIVAGRLNNQRFIPTHDGRVFSHAIIKPGPGGGLRTDLGDIKLDPQPIERYESGQQYHQDKNELHISDPEDGCITVNQRVRHGEDEAIVCWMKGTNWVSAEPRTAVNEEVNDIVSNALRLL